MSNIIHDFDGKKGAFRFKQEEAFLAEMEYVMAGEDKMIIDHTRVDESLRGQGIGKKLQEQLVQHVREHQIKVVPLCPFAKAMFKKNEEWQDVLS